MIRNLSILFLLIFISCSNDGTNRNPYLLEVNFRFDANLNLPTYNPLTNIGSAVFVPNEGVGTKGVFIINTGFDQFRAFEASCPNHAPNECSTMTLDGQTVTCSCENYEYSLFTGQLLERPEDGKRYYDMLEYRASLSGNTVVVSN
ncbi:Rieske (2Fe-2S) protein [Maribacter sp. LLG6340-A2]|uniref:Rieske (2Fe-2S) protein n=1 Tax=Maribacter sp. LLG6340-A2 TaxID=3160834 RepID=UPI00386A48F9